MNKRIRSIYMMAGEYGRNYLLEYNDRKLSFYVYSPDHEIIQQLRDSGKINHIPWIDHNDLMDKLISEYDVGICLWHPIQKFQRNLPLRNFDYMGVGLPIISSKFSNLKLHLEKSGAGICNNPFHYDDFERAIRIMFSPKNVKNFRIMALSIHILMHHFKSKVNHTLILLGIYSRLNIPKECSYDKQTKTRTN